MANIQGHEIDSVEFWAKRLQQAKDVGVIHYSVFLANPTLWARLLKAHLRIINQYIKPSDKVLDAGCGYGRMSTVFENYTGVDFSTDFIREAKNMFPDKDFRVADLRDLPFKDKEFDWGIAISIKNMIVGNLGKSEWNKMEKELRRVCKKVLLLEYGELESDRDTDEQLAEHEIL